MNDLNGKVAVVTGGAGNLGQATVRALLAAGCQVVAVDRSTERAAAIYGGGGSLPEGLQVMAADLSDAADVTRLVAEIRKRLGRIDVLVNTVGTFRGGKPVHTEDAGVWEQLFKINVMTAVLMSRAVIPPMLEQESGRIINVGSRNALEGSANVAAYSATKAAVLRLTESMAQELKTRGVNINAVLPATIDTPQNREAMPDADFDKWVSPEAIADVIVFLASDAARAITGAAIPIYGRG